MKKKWMILFMVVFSALSFSSYAEASPLLNKLLDEFERNEKTQGIVAGLYIYDVHRNREWYRFNHTKSFVPASNVKLLTTAAALDILKPDYRFRTEIYIDGKIDANGTLQGDLALKGYGDPSLSEADLQLLARKLKDMGIKKINGNLIMDDTFFDDVKLGPGWMWDDEAFDYSAQVSALSVNKNTVTLEIHPAGQMGDSPSVLVSPIDSYTQVINQVKIIEGIDQQIHAKRVRGTNKIILTGFMGNESSSTKIDVTIEDPALFTGHVFKRILKKELIRFPSDSKIEKSSISEDAPLFTHFSSPLEELIVPLNKNSDNFYAEMMFKTLGAQKGMRGSFEAGSKAVTAFMQRAGTHGVYKIVDGSGLSRLNRFSPQQMTQLLRYVLTQPYRDAFLSSLPVGGVDGTLKHRMRSIHGERQIIAKTGTMKGVSCLSGFIVNQDKIEFCFSIFLNGFTEKTADLRQFQDEVCAILSNHKE